MRKYLLLATATALVASPALAGAPGPYVGLEGGVTLPQSSDLDVVLNNTSANPVTTTTYNNGYNVKYKTGWDVDAIAGYKFGLFRLEAEGGYQRANGDRRDGKHARHHQRRRRLRPQHFPVDVPHERDLRVLALLQPAAALSAAGGTRAGGCPGGDRPERRGRPPAWNDRFPLALRRS